MTIQITPPKKPKTISKLSDLEFAVAFRDIQRRILEDPIKNFVRAQGLINFKPTPAQTVALKCIFGQALDKRTKHPVYQEKMDRQGNFDLKSVEMSETQLYEFMTEFPYEGKDKERNRINLICGRRCLAEGTDVLTPNGPKPIEFMEVGDDVYGFTKDGSVEVTKVTQVWKNGRKKLKTITTYDTILAECTEEHTWLTSTYHNKLYRQKKVEDFDSKDQYIIRRFVDIPCGSVHEPHAYVLGAMLGDGCCRQEGKTERSKQIYISSESALIPEKLSSLLKGEFRKNKGGNYTWAIIPGIKINHYKEWCHQKYAHEKFADIDVIDTWDRESCLQFMAGLLDTDGCIRVRKDCKSLSLAFGMQSKPVVIVFAYLFYKLFQKKLYIYEDDRKKYKNGSVFSVSTASNLYVKRALKELDPYIVTERKKWKLEYETFPNRSFTPDKIGVSVIDRNVEAETYDITVGNDSNLYMLANEGIITHNSGKSSVAAILAIYSCLKVNWKPLLKKTPVATVAVLSHSIEFSQEILDIIKGLMDESEVLSRLRDPNRKNTQSTFHLKVPFLQDDDETVIYSSVAIKVGAASKKTTRGRAVCTLLCDEIAYWSLDKESAEPDHEILRAIRPALMQFGRHAMMIKLSSPAIKQGVLYDEWKRREELKDDYIQFKSPSWVWNTILPVEEFKNEFRLDPEGFDAELRANFVDSISDFISPEFVDLCVMPGVKFLPPTMEKDTMYFAAIDAAFKGDRFAFCLVGINEKRVTQYCLKLWEGNKKTPVQASDVAQYIRQVTRDYGLNQVAADQYAFQPLKEIFGQFGITLVENTFSIQYKRKIYFGLKRLIHNSQIDLLDEPLLVQEIKQLQVKQTPSGQISIGHPEGRGFTDDASDATAIAAYIAMEHAGMAGITSGGDSANGYSIETDIQGRSFVAPAVEMLNKYKGFEHAIDNTSEWVKDPKTGAWKHISEISDESDEMPNFMF